MMAVGGGASNMAWKVVARMADKMSVNCVHKLVDWIADCWISLFFAISVLAISVAVAIRQQSARHGVP